MSSSGSDDDDDDLSATARAPSAVGDAGEAPTGPGVTSWFVPYEVAEHEGGVVKMSFGPMGDTTSKVTAWAPPHRVVFVDDGERPMAQEWLVEAKEGSSCVVRLVNSGFGEGEECDND